MCACTVALRGGRERGSGSKRAREQGSKGEGASEGGAGERGSEGAKELEVEGRARVRARERESERESKRQREKGREAVLDLASIVPVLVFWSIVSAEVLLSAKPCGLNF